MPCENQKECDFYQKMLPLFKEVLYDKLPQFNPAIDSLYNICDKGVLKSGEKCTTYEIKICKEYPNYTTIKSRTTLWFREALIDTSVNVCLLKKGHCMHELEGLRIEDIERNIENFSKML